MIAIIPARGGSKRIPQKNIRLFYGVPIIERTVRAAITSRLFSRVIVSTDDEKIAKLAKLAGADVPFLRDAKLSDDFTGTVEVIRDCLNRIGDFSSIVTCIYPVTPLLDYRHIAESQEIVESSDFDYVFAAGKLQVNPSRSFLLSGDNSIHPVDIQGLAMRTQDLKQHYFDLGQFYTARAKVWNANTPILTDRSRAVVLNPWEAVDVDSESDWKLCELMFQINANKLD